MAASTKTKTTDLLEVEFENGDAETFTACVWFDRIVYAKNRGPSTKIKCNGTTEGSYAPDEDDPTVTMGWNIKDLSAGSAGLKADASMMDFLLFDGPYSAANGISNNYDNKTVKITINLDATAVGDAADMPVVYAECEVFAPEGSWGQDKAPIVGSLEFAIVGTIDRDGA